MVEALARDEKEFLQQMLPQGITLPKDHRSPLTEELMASYDSVHATLDKMGVVRCQGWYQPNKVHGCKTNAETAYWPVDWFELRKNGVPFHMRADPLMWIAVCGNCALLMRKKRKTAWTKAQSPQPKYWWYDEAQLAMVENCRKPIRYITEGVEAIRKRVTTYQIAPGKISLLITGNVVHIDASHLRDDGTVSVVCYT